MKRKRKLKRVQRLLISQLVQIPKPLPKHNRLQLQMLPKLTVSLDQLENCKFLTTLRQKKKRKNPQSQYLIKIQALSKLTPQQNKKVKLKDLSQELLLSFHLKFQSKRFKQLYLREQFWRSRFNYTHIVVTTLLCTTRTCTCSSQLHGSQSV